MVAAIVAFSATFAIALGVTGTAYVWHVNMISDLGDGLCRIRGGRWICSPGFAMFNTGMVVTGALLTVGATCVSRLWGRLFGGSVVVMGVGLMIAGVFPAGDDGSVHLVGVVLALVVPGLGLLVSAIPRQTAWLSSRRLTRGGLGAVALLFCAESRLPGTLLPRGAGELIIVGCLLLALFIEAVPVLLAPRAESKHQRRPAAEVSAGSTG